MDNIPELLCRHRLVRIIRINPDVAIRGNLVNSVLGTELLSGLLIDRVRIGLRLRLAEVEREDVLTYFREHYAD